MDYINFYVALPHSAYLKLEDCARKMKTTKNEIILNAILNRNSSDNKDFRRIKNAGIERLYNKT